MKNPFYITLLLFLCTSCQKECDDIQPDYSGQYTGKWQLPLSISDISGFPPGNVSLPGNINLSISITEDPDSINILWISGLYGTSKPIPAIANASGFEIISVCTGIRLEDIGFQRVSIGGPNFDNLSISGYYANGTLTYTLSDNDWDLLSCSGPLTK